MQRGVHRLTQKPPKEKKEQLLSKARAVTISLSKANLAMRIFLKIRNSFKTLRMVLRDH